MYILKIDQLFMSILNISLFQNTVLPQALSYWEKALFVKPLNVPIKLNRLAFTL